MPAIQSLQRAVATLTESPVLFVGGLAIAGIVAPQTALGFAGQFLGGSTAGVASLVGNGLTLVTFFLTPLVVAGTLGMAREALEEGQTSLATFSTVARERYLTLLLAVLLQVGIVLALGILALVVLVVGLAVALFFVDVGPSAAIATDPSRLLQPDVLVVAVLTLLVAALVFYGPRVFLQFFAVAVVTDDAGPVEGYRRSVGLVRRNFVSTLGFTAVRVVLSLAVALPPLVATGLRLGGIAATGGSADPQTMAGAGVFSPAGVVALTAFVLVVQVVLMPFTQTYARAFYAAAGGDEPGVDAAADPDHPDPR